MKKILIFIMFIFTLTSCTGMSAYDLAVENGFEGTVEDYLDSLKGEDAPLITIEDIFQSLVDLGYYTSEQYTDFLSDYLNDYLKELNDEEVVTNNSLISAVSIYSNFTYEDTISTSLGSGVVYKIDENIAYIVTNHHVIDNPYDSGTPSSDINVYFTGMEYTEYTYTAEFVGWIESYDIAVLSVVLDSAVDYVEAVKIASCRTYAGDNAYVVGNALGSGISITKGVVSVESEYITYDDESDYLRVLRIDASINSGNSGGGLFNKYGELIGIVNAKISSVSVEGFGYAIPISVVDGIVDNLIRNNGTVNKVTLGITTSIESSTLVYDTDDLKYYIKEKVTVASVISDSPAKTAGLKTDDELLSVTINGVTTSIERHYTLSELLFYVDYEDTITISIYRASTVSFIDIEVTF